MIADSLGSLGACPLALNIHDLVLGDNPADEVICKSTVL
jgi:hypothetical protein